jgi:hypothetical protein
LAFNALEEGRGSLFDARIVDAITSYYKREFRADREGLDVSNG